jgi:hypothetical protein
LLSRDGREQGGYLNLGAAKKGRACVSWRLQQRRSLASVVQARGTSVMQCLQSGFQLWPMSETAANALIR